MCVFRGPRAGVNSVAKLPARQRCKHVTGTYVHVPRACMLLLYTYVIIRRTIYPSMLEYMSRALGLVYVTENNSTPPIPSLHNTAIVYAQKKYGTSA